MTFNIFNLHLYTAVLQELEQGSTQMGCRRYEVLEMLIAGATEVKYSIQRPVGIIKQSNSSVRELTSYAETDIEFGKGAGRPSK